MPAPLPRRAPLGPLVCCALALSAGALGCSAAAHDTTSPPAPTTQAAQAEPMFQAAAVSPLTHESPLQVVSIFSYQPGEALISPATDLALLVARPRTEEGFGKEPLRTLLLDPAPAPVKAQKLLFVALGPREEFSLDRLKAVGATAMREALARKVAAFAFAPIARDQGVTTLPADAVAAAFVEGALVEYAAERRANPSTSFALREVTYEAGPQFVDAVGKAVARGVEAAHSKAPPAASP